MENSNWISEKLGSVLEIKYGKDHKKLEEGNFPCLGSGGIMRYVDSYLYDDESILIPRKGSLNNIIFQNNPFWTVDTMFWSKIDKSKVFPKFLFYQLTLIDYENLNVGSAVPSLTVPVINEIEITLPELPEQKAIASVLSSLDDKIDLLHQQNQTLEALAETLFRQWFIEEAKEDWDEVKLKSICSINNGYAFKSETYTLSGHVIVRTMNFNQNYIDLNNLVYISDEFAKSFSKYQLKRNDFLLVMVGASLGKSAIVTEDVLPSLQNQNMWSFRAHEIYLQHYLNHALRDIVNENLHSASGSAREFFQKGVFYELEIILPPVDLLKQFSAVCENNLTKIENNRYQIQTLNQLRYTLLPKLMSGEVRVNL